MSMQHDIARLKRQPRGRTKTFAELQAEAEAYEHQGEWGMAAVMWNVAESVAATPEQKATARERRSTCSKMR